MKNTRLLSALVFFSFYFASCKLNALVSCAGVTTLKTDLGYVDAGGLNFGNLLLIDTVNRAVNGWKVVAYDRKKDIILRDSAATLINNIQEGLTVNLSGSGADDAIKAGVELILTNQLNLHVVNYKREDFIDPDMILAEPANNGIINECKEPTRKGQVVMLVTSMATGDTNQIYIGKTRAVNANGSKETILTFQVHVEYNCSGNYEKTGNQVNLYFKAQFYTCDPVKGLINITGTRQFDLTKYSFTNARHGNPSGELPK